MSKFNIHPRLEEAANVIHAAGFTVTIPTSQHRTNYQAGHIYVTRDGQPGVALVQVPALPWFEPLSLDIPVEPTREYGSAVCADYRDDGNFAGLIAKLDEVMRASTVRTRFVTNPRTVPVDRRVPADGVVFVPTNN